MKLKYTYWVRPINDDVMCVVGNQDLEVVDEKYIMNDKFIKFNGFKGWFNSQDFEDVK
jgi:hypothetical protein